MTPSQASDIKAMEKAGRLAAACLKHTGQFVKAGVSTAELDQIAEDYVSSRGGKSAPLGYRGYPKSICTSVNACICHGLPTEKEILKDGDIINIDVTAIVDEFHGDTSATFFVGAVSDEAKDVTRVAYEAMHRGIEAITPGGKTGDIGFAIQKFVTRSGYYAVKDIGGHGIGRKFHDEPFVPSFGKKGKGQSLPMWGCITVEPMVNVKNTILKEESIPDSDIKIYHTHDGCLSAQFEHTILIKDKGYEILTLDGDEAISF